MGAVEAVMTMTMVAVPAVMGTAVNIRIINVIGAV